MLFHVSCPSSFFDVQIVAPTNNTQHFSSLRLLAFPNGQIAPHCTAQVPLQWRNQIFAPSTTMWGEDFFFTCLDLGVCVPSVHVKTTWATSSIISSMSATIISWWIKWLAYLIKWTQVPYLASLKTRKNSDKNAELHSL